MNLALERRVGKTIMVFKIEIFCCSALKCFRKFCNSYIVSLQSLLGLILRDNFLFGKVVKS